MIPRKVRQHTFVTGLLLSTFALLALAGCPEDRPKPDIREVVGTIEQVDTTHNVVKVRSYVAKHEAYSTFMVHVTDETEIMINGSLAKLGDLRLGERAEGRIRIDKQSGGNTFTALAVKVERGEVLQAPPSAADAAGEKANGGDASSNGETAAGSADTP